MGLKNWWKTGAAPNDYESGLAEETFQGQRVASLRSIVHQPAASRVLPDDRRRGLSRQTHPVLGGA